MKKTTYCMCAVIAINAGQVQAGGVVCAVVDSLWTQGHTSAQSTITTGIDGMVSSFATTSATTTSMIVSAIKVLTSQDSFEAQSQAIATKQALQAVGETFSEQRAAEEIVEAYNTYGPPGQAVGSCEVMSDIGIHNSALQSVENRASEIIMSGGIDARAGSTVTHTEALQKRAAVSESDEDLVTSAEALFDPNTSAPVKDTYMNNIVGIPLPKPSGLNSVSDNLQLIAARRAEALRSPAIASLAAVRASSEQAGHFHTAGLSGVSTRSLEESIDWLVDRYGGGSEHEEWSAALATKSEVGLMKEITRLYSLRLGLINEMNASADRRQVVLGSVIATEVGK